MVPQGGGAKSGGALPKLRFFYTEKAFFSPKRLQNPKRRNEGKRLLHFTGAVTSS